MFLTRCTVLTALLVCAAGFLTNLTASELCVVVIDEANLPLPNAWINVTRMLKPTADANNSPIKAYNSSTDAKGAACLAIPEGTYSVEVGLTGFLNVRYYPVRLMYPYGRRLNFQLPIGDVTEDGVTAEAI